MLGGNAKMSDYESRDRHRSYHGSANVWSLAALSAAVFLCSVLGAKVLSSLVEKERLARAAYERAVREASAKGRQGLERHPSYPAAGVDDISTGTIRPQATPVSPCGEKEAGKVGQ